MDDLPSTHGDRHGEVSGTGAHEADEMRPAEVVLIEFRGEVDVRRVDVDLGLLLGHVVPMSGVVAREETARRHHTQLVLTERYYRISITSWYHTGL